VRLTAVEAELVRRILADSLDCFRLEPDGFLLRVDWFNRAVVLLKLPSHAPGILHSVTVVNVVAKFSLWSTSLEAHHPGRAILRQAVEVR